MSGMVLRMMTGGLLGDSGGCLMCCGAVLAVCAVCGLYKCAQLRMRDCSCIKWILRKTGTDEFDDFALSVIVHQATFTFTGTPAIKIRLSAGINKVETSEAVKGMFQEVLEVLIEQGTHALAVELYDTRAKKVLASTKIEVLKGILNSKTPLVETEYILNPACKEMRNPRVKLTMRRSEEMDAESSIMADMNLSKQTEMLLQQQLMKSGHNSAAEQRNSLGPNSQGGAPAAPAVALTPAQRLSQGLKGNLEMFGSWGATSPVYVAVAGPPAQKKFSFNIYKDEASYEKGHKPTTEVDLLKVLGVSEDPGRADVFIIVYVDAQKAQNRLSFKRIDMPSGTWVELLWKLVELIRQEKEAKSVKKR